MLDILYVNTHMSDEGSELYLGYNDISLQLVQREVFTLIVICMQKSVMKCGESNQECSCLHS